MKRINANTRAELVNRLQRVVDAFNDEDACFDKISPEHMPPDHYAFVKSLIGVNIGKLKSARLRELCRQFDIAFVAGDYGYTAEQNSAVNELADIVYDVLR